MSEYSLTDSLGKVDYGQTYWVAVNEEKRVVGITGFYDDKCDSSVVWLGWYGVHPTNRKRGIGSKLLQFAIEEAGRRGFSTIKLYTSSDAGEKAAHKLYLKFGFSLYAENKKTDKIYFRKDI